MRILDGFPKSAHPMGVLASLTSALISFNPKTVDVESDEEMYKAIVKIMAKFPVLTAWVFRNSEDEVLTESDSDLDYVENLCQMFFKKEGEKYEQNPVIVNALNQLLILHADHEQNCSTSTVRIVGSSHAGYLHQFLQEFRAMG